MTIKNIIERYIIYGIDTGEWKVGSKIPSENSLAVRFNCSRTTVRTALHTLMGRKMLFSKKCKGYFVCDNFTPDKLINTHKFVQLYMNRISPSFFRSLNYNCSDLTRRYLIMNRDSKQENKSMELLLLNKDLYRGVFPNKNWASINRAIMTKVKLTKIVKSIIFNNDDIFSSVSKKLKWGDKFPKLVKCYIAENNKVIFVSVKAFKKSDFAIKTIINI